MRKIKLNRKANGKYKMEYTNIEARLLNQLSKLNYILSKNKVLDLVELVGNTKKLLIRNFVSGIIKGIGAGIGFSIITALIIYLLQKIIKLNIPVISKYISDIIEIVQNTK